MSMFQKKEKDIKIAFISPKQMSSDMDELVKHYDTNISDSDLQETRKILSKTSSLNEELSNMREENRRKKDSILIHPQSLKSSQWK